MQMSKISNSKAVTVKAADVQETSLRTFKVIAQDAGVCKPFKLLKASIISEFVG